MSKRTVKVIDCESAADRSRVQEALDRLGFSYCVDRLHGNKYRLSVYTDERATPKEIDVAGEIKSVHLSGNLLGVSARVHITLHDGTVITREGMNRSTLQQELEKTIGEIRASVQPLALAGSSVYGSWLR